MLTSDFDYHLPLEFIAQTPIEPRHNSRLLVMRRDSGMLEDSQFYKIGAHLNPGDLLVINQTRVIPARLHARKNTGGRVELLLLKQREAGLWEALVGGKGLREGVRVRVENGPEVEVVKELAGSERLIRFLQPVDDLLPSIGEMPLPPYIHEKLQVPERYQTVYAAVTGSAAAPTAGLHFTPQLMHGLKQKGIASCMLTLHVGAGTFKPIATDTLAERTLASATPMAALRLETAARAFSTATVACERLMPAWSTCQAALSSSAKLRSKPRVAGLLSSLCPRCHLPDR